MSRCKKKKEARLEGRRMKAGAHNAISTHLSHGAFPHAVHGEERCRVSSKAVQLCSGASHLLCIVCETDCKGSELRRTSALRRHMEFCSRLQMQSILVWLGFSEAPRARMSHSYMKTIRVLFFGMCSNLDSTRSVGHATCVRKGTTGR